MSVEAELSVRHVTVGDEAGWRQLLAARVRVDAHHAAGQAGRAGAGAAPARAARWPRRRACGQTGEVSGEGQRRAVVVGGEVAVRVG